MGHHRALERDYNFGPGDQIVSFAQSHTMRVRGHNLVWHSQLPGWVSSLPLNQVQGVMESHITTEATHYRGKVYAWDVVNEPFNEDGSLRQDVFYKAMGTNYIADALRTAHAADPNAKLYLNDYNIEGQNAKSNGMYSLAQSLLSQGVPLNGIGLESHFIVGQVPSSLQANMQRFAALGPGRGGHRAGRPHPAAGLQLGSPAAGHRLRQRGQGRAWRSPAVWASPSGASTTGTPGSVAPSPGTAPRPCTTATTSPSRPTTPPSPPSAAPLSPRAAATGYGCVARGGRGPVSGRAEPSRDPGYAGADL